MVLVTFVSYPSNEPSKKNVFFCVLFITFSNSTQTVYLFLHRYQWRKIPKIAVKRAFLGKNHCRGYLVTHSSYLEKTYTTTALEPSIYTHSPHVFSLLAVSYVLVQYAENINSINTTNTWLVVLIIGSF